MKRAKLLIAAIAAVTIVATAAVGLLVSETWAIIVAVAGLMAALVATAYVTIKSVQLVLQRVAGLQKQQERLIVAQRALHAAVGQGTSNATEIRLPAETKRALEELTLASRSLTVPQAHFDQLLRTISANTSRTEAALDDAVAEMIAAADKRACERPHETH